MALANIAKADGIGGAPGQPTYVDRVTLDLDNSYTTGGYDLAEGTADRTAFNAEIGAGRTILAMVQQGQQQEGTAGIHASYDYANSKLQVFDSATGLELANATDLSNITTLALMVFSK
jgi:hypothetical protein